MIGGRKWLRFEWRKIREQSQQRHILTFTIWPFWYWESQANGQPLWLIEDGALAYKTKLPQAQQNLYQIPSIIWPPSSPDLNPIGNIWNLLKNHLNPHNSRSKGKNQVKIAVLKEWERITDKDLQKFVDSMSERVQAVIIANRGHTGSPHFFIRHCLITPTC